MYSLASNPISPRFAESPHRETIWKARKKKNTIGAVNIKKKGKIVTKRQSTPPFFKILFTHNIHMISCAYNSNFCSITKLWDMMTRSLGFMTFLAFLTCGLKLLGFDPFIGK
jgi:hypothetical protein